LETPWVSSAANFVSLNFAPGFAFSLPISIGSYFMC
jgi:hypothetical protein